MSVERGGEYEKKGDYHKELDKNWKYYPVYKKKMEYLDGFFKSVPKNSRILDVGCGEGILVEKLHKMGYDVTGLDLAYSSDLVRKGDILNMPFPDGGFDYILCLDVLEHLYYDKQAPAILEMKRVLKSDGVLVLSLPNLAHFASRISFLFTGRLLRTSSIDRHPGDRPIKEFYGLAKNAGFSTYKIKGIFPTFPCASVLTYLYPGKVLALHGFLNRFFAYPPICFLNIMFCRKSR